MSEIVIQVEGLGKRYQLGSIGSGTLRNDLNSWWARWNGKEDPTKKIGFERSWNNRDEYWSLKDVNFEVKRGDTLGIIGTNGAGKSTLLKVLSRVTGPTEGEIKIKGRIASLLEVGTGFHPELSGRENIFLNGAILGMSKTEIKSKIDEIIFFSGVERYIDTPVKRYSSGMYVRLAFAVAAHLEPEILILDEVLAVGDAEFQKKCLGKMKEVSSEGRTILFVSHNMASVRKLCNNGLLLKSGSVVFNGPIKATVENYLSQTINDGRSEITWKLQPSITGVQIVGLRLLKEDGTLCNTFFLHESFYVELEFVNTKNNNKIIPYVELRDRNENGVLSSANWSSATANIDPYSNRPYQKGQYKSRMKIPGNLLNDGSYFVNVWLLENVSTTAAEVDDFLTVTILDTNEMRNEYLGEWVGVIRPKLEWNTMQIDYDSVLENNCKKNQ